MHFMISKSNINYIYINIFAFIFNFNFYLFLATVLKWNWFSILTMFPMTLVNMVMMPVLLFNFGIIYLDNHGICKYSFICSILICVAFVLVLNIMDKLLKRQTTKITQNSLDNLNSFISITKLNSKLKFLWLDPAAQCR